MRHFGLPLLVVSSLVVGSALGATRPHYGGTLRVLARAAPVSLDPADLERAGGAGRNLSRLLFDTLVSLDDFGIVQPALANSWQSDPGNQRWQFSLRHGVTFSDGTPLTAEGVAGVLRVANPRWRVSADVETVVIQLESPDARLPAELALVRNSVVRRDGRNLPGTGPFTVMQWQPGKKLTLSAREDYWSGRPFLGSIEIDFANDSRLPAIDWTRYQLAEIAPEQVRRAAASGRRTGASSASDLLALVFTRPAASPEEGQLRDALSLSINRQVLNDVPLQGGGEPARGLLPGWMTGYDFLFPTGTDLPLARQAVGGVRLKASWSLGFDANDPAARLIAERIALDANDIGIRLAPTASNSADMSLVKLSMASLNPQVALSSLAADAGLTPPRFADNSSEELYSTERTLLQTRRVIPLVHLRAAFALAGSVDSWTMSRNGDWHMADVWLGAERP